jgi:hypothetical protein
MYGFSREDAKNRKGAKNFFAALRSLAALRATKLPSEDSGSQKALFNLSTIQRINSVN